MVIEARLTFTICAAAKIAYAADDCHQPGKLLCIAQSSAVTTRIVIEVRLNTVYPRSFAVCRAHVVGSSSIGVGTTTVLQQLLEVNISTYWVVGHMPPSPLDS